MICIGCVLHQNCPLACSWRILAVALVNAFRFPEKTPTWSGSRVAQVRFRGIRGPRLVIVPDL